MAEEGFDLGNGIGHKIGKRWSRAAGSPDGGSNECQTVGPHQPPDDEAARCSEQDCSDHEMEDAKGNAETTRTSTNQPQLMLKPKGTPVHLVRSGRNICHWHCMLPVFIALQQARLLPDGDELTKQATGFVSVIRRVADGMHERMDKKLKVCLLD